MPRSPRRERDRQVFAQSAAALSAWQDMIAEVRPQAQVRCTARGPRARDEHKREAQDEDARRKSAVGRSSARDAHKTKRSADRGHARERARCAGQAWRMGHGRATGGGRAQDERGRRTEGLEACLSIRAPQPPMQFLPDMRVRFQELHHLKVPPKTAARKDPGH